MIEYIHISKNILYIFKHIEAADAHEHIHGCGHLCKYVCVRMYVHINMYALEYVASPYERIAV